MSAKNRNETRINWHANFFLFLFQNAYKFGNTVVKRDQTMDKSNMVNQRTYNHKEKRRKNKDRHFMECLNLCIS